jgi:hypothetical protein
MAENYFREGSRLNWFSDAKLTEEQIKVGALLRIADSLEELNQWVKPFPGCHLAKLFEKALTKGITIKRKIVIEIKWPWSRKKKRRRVKCG